MNYTLLIWEEIPEHTTLYLIPNEVVDKYRNYLEQAHNKIINVDDENDGMCFLKFALLDAELTDEELPSYIEKEEVGVFAEYKVKDKDTPISDKTITYVYLSGFYM